MICIVRSSHIFHSMLLSLRLYIRDDHVLKKKLIFVRGLLLQHISGQFGCYHYNTKLPNELLVIDYIKELFVCYMY